MFQRFTDRARRVVILAQEESRLHQHNYIGTEHVLLGLIREGEGVAAQALRIMNVSIEDACKQLDEMVGMGAGPVTTGHIPFTPRAKKVMELSLREALQLGHNYIGTEHVLLGLIREGQGVAATILTRLGVELEATRTTVLTLLASYQPSSIVVEQPPEETEVEEENVLLRLALAVERLAAAIEARGM